MLTICRTLMGDPDLIIVDEPTEGLAPNSSRGRVLTCGSRPAGSRNSPGRAETHHCARISQRSIYVMGHGRIVYQGTPADFLAKDLVRQQWLEV